MLQSSSISSRLIELFSLLAIIVSRSIATEEEPCYADLGCFGESEIGKNGSFFRFDRRDPDPPSAIGISFFFFSCDHPFNEESVPYYVTVQQLQKLENFNPRLMTVIIVHGFQASYNEMKWTGDIKDLLVVPSTCNKNVIAVNWPKGSHKSYQQAAADTLVVGASIAKLIEKLHLAFKVEADQFICAGHSLGAHICGYAGYRLMETKMRLIIGMDPAGPGFTGIGPLHRLDPTDATLVLTIHTNGATNFVSGFGTLVPMGHYSFFVNGGEKQPGCSRGKNLAGILESGFTQAVEEAVTCSHSRAPYLVAYDEQRFDDYQTMAYRCSSYSDFEMGRCYRCDNEEDCKRFGSWFDYWPTQYPDKSWVQPVIYYTDTRDRLPYSLFFYAVQIDVGSSFKYLPARMTLNITGDIRTTYHAKFDVDRDWQPNYRYSFLFKLPKSIGRLMTIGAQLTKKLVRFIYLNENDVVNVTDFYGFYMNGLEKTTREKFSGPLLPVDGTLVNKDEEIFYEYSAKKIRMIDRIDRTGIDDVRRFNEETRRNKNKEETTSFENFPTF
ncbi:phospholipase A2-like [Sarcoptes scabiei]|nr:phospholipase A2-like [Sarcoptes scabiei]